MDQVIWDGAKLAKRMESKRLNNEAVGVAVGVTWRVVHNWRGGVEPRPERVDLLAYTLGCERGDFYTVTTIQEG